MLFGLSAHWQESFLSISPMIDQMNFSQEFNTLYMASSPRARFRTLSQLLWLFSMYQSAFLCEYISSNVNIYFILSNQQTGSTDQLEHLESFCSASKAQDSSLVHDGHMQFCNVTDKCVHYPYHPWIQSLLDSIYGL